MLLKGKMTYLECRSIDGKKGTFRVLKLGNRTKCTSFDVFVPSDINLEAFKSGQEVEIDVEMEQKGYKLSATLRAIK